MELFNFFKKTGAKEDETFVGRHQQVYFVKHLLGEEVPSLNWQIAKNKDLSERNEILEKIDDLEKYINSEFYTTTYDVATTHEKIKEIIKQGFNTHVLQNDSDLEKRCFDIYKQVIEYSISNGKKHGTMTDKEIADIKMLPEFQNDIGRISLMGGDFDTPLEQHVWMVYFSLLPKSYHHGLITIILAGVSEREINILVPGFKLAISKLIENKKIDKDDEKKILEMIEEGIAINKTTPRLHKK